MQKQIKEFSDIEWKRFKQLLIGSRSGDNMDFKFLARSENLIFLTREDTKYHKQYPTSYYIYNVKDNTLFSKSNRIKPTREYP